MLKSTDHMLAHLDAYLHDLLSDVESQAVEEHCQRCRICQVALEEARKRLDALRSLSLVTPSDETRARLTARLSATRRPRFTPARLAIGLAASMALLIGAFHSYYLRLAPTPYDLRVLGQTDLWPDSDASLRVLLANHTTRQPLAGVPVEIELANSAGDQTMQLARLTTDSDGTASPRLRLPNWNDGDYTLRVSAFPGHQLEKIEHRVKLRREWQLTLASDKPVYQPGQTIRLRALALRRPDLAPVGGQDAIFSIHDPKGNKIFSQRCVTSRFGISYVDCPLADEILEGDYSVECRVGAAASKLILAVKKYTLPKFKLDVVLDREYYQPGQKLHGSLQVDYFFGQPVSGGEARVELQTQAIGPTTLATAIVRTDSSGHATFDFLLPDKLVGRPQDAGAATISVVVNLRDTAGQQQSKSITRSVTAHPIQIEVLPESGALVRDIANTIYLLTSYPDGRPAKTRVMVSGQDREFETNELGVTSFEFGFRGGTTNWSVRATDNEGVDGQREIRLNCDVHDGDFLVRPDKAVYTGGDTMRLFAFGLGVEPVFLDFVKDGQTVLTQTVDLVAGRGRREIDLPAGLSGPILLSAYRYAADGLPVRKSRVIYVHAADTVRITTTLDRGEYRPGERAILAFQLNDSQGRPAPGALSLAAVDPAVFHVLSQTTGVSQTFSRLEAQLLEPVYAIYPWSPETNIDPLRANGEFKLGQVEELQRALFSVTARSSITSQQGLDREWDVVGPPVAPDRPDWRELAETDGVSPHMFELPNSHGEPYSLVAQSFPSKESASAKVRQNGLEAVKVAWILFGVGVVLPMAIRLFFRTRFWEIITALVILGFLIALLLPAVQSAREAARRSTAQWESAPAAAAAMVAETAVAAKDGIAPRLRERFPETLLWRPELITDDQGRATLDLDLADSITTWRLSATAVTSSGKLGATEESIRVFQPFFVDLNLPATLTRGDEIAAPVVVYNYLDTPETVELRWKERAGVKLLGESSQRLELMPREVRSTSFRMQAIDVGRHALEVEAVAGQVADAVRRQIDVMPDGRCVEHVTSGQLALPAQIDIVAPADAIPGSAKCSLTLYPSTFSQLAEGLETIFQQPYGCFEQTSSTTYPNVLALEYLRATNQSVPAIEARARAYIHLGYQRLLSFEIAGGGFDWFGNPPANRTLTAYGLQEFVDMAQVHDVDPALIARTRNWLLATQQTDGSWAPEAHGMHEDPTRRSGLARLSTTAYIASAVFSGGAERDAARRALAYLVSTRPEQIDNPYTLALVARAICEIEPRGARAADYLDRLAALAQTSPDGKLVWWNLPSGGSSLFYGAGRSGDIEATALATLACMDGHRHIEKVRGALAWLVAQKNARGGWGSTQATVLTLKALLAASRTPIGGETARVIELAIDGQQVERVTIPTDQADVTREIDLTPQLSSGSHQLTITELGAGGSSFKFVNRNYLPTNEKQPATTESLAIELTYGRSELMVGETTSVRAVIENRQSTPAPMVVVDLPIPPGFSPDPSEFERLVATGVIAKYQATPRRVIVYLRELRPGQQRELEYTLWATTPVKVSVPGAVAYEYYDPDVRATGSDTALIVQNR